jgi:putative transposon-encoded protein
MGNAKQGTYDLHDFTLPKISISGFGPIEKEVKQLGKSGGSSGVIYVPKKFVGKKFKVLLIPLENFEEYSKEMVL